MTVIRTVLYLFIFSLLCYTCSTQHDVTVGCE